MIRELNEVIHASSDANLSGFTYTSVYASATASPVINGTTVSMEAGVTIPIKVMSISSEANVYVLGCKKIIVPSIING